jgi:hypothetical protein
MIFENLPIELHWNVLKFLRHPVAEIFIEQKAYNKYLSTFGDTYDGFDMNDLITFYDVWRIYNRKPYKVVYRIVTRKIEK